MLKWAYGVTTVPERQRDEFNRTIASLKVAGFDKPRVFVDGWDGKETKYINYSQYNLEMTVRYPKVRVYGNWIMALIELFIREPTADRYAIFQDDLVTYPNLREYLEKTPFPDKGYCNLYTFRENEDIAREAEAQGKTGWLEATPLFTSPPVYYHGKLLQAGRSALALIFKREGVITLLSQQGMVIKPLQASVGWRRVDGAIVQAMNMVGWREYIHNPSLVQHTGQRSTIGNRSKTAITFRGEEYDALSMLPSTQLVTS